MEVKFLAIPDVVSYPLLMAPTETLNNINIIFRELNKFDEINEIDGFNGDIFSVYIKTKDINNLRPRWVLVRNYIWVLERRRWLINDSVVGTKYGGSVADIALRIFTQTLGMKIKIINYEDLDELLYDYEHEKLNAVILPLYDYGVLGIHPNYPIDKLFMNILGTILPGLYAIAVREQAANIVKMIYVQGVKKLKENNSINILKEKIINTFNINISTKFLNLIINNVKFELMNSNCVNIMCSRLRTIYNV
ncbi:DUF3834 domain-containing protein [Vulcanisaeta thermophila]|uniref:DUF3834 domain-containing protein n=1 Tax=Vulcanisaeta thermophila TaxID=867917 RepID=UPI000853A2D7|nr:DUF3834 domain-containing protein [Vulcanisaeta thermophila]